MFNTRYFSNKQEKHIAKELGGRQTSNSGATKWYKGDIELGNKMLIEAKTTTSFRKSFSIKKDWIDKNEEEAFAMRKPYSALAFDFGDGEQHYIINEKLFKVLLEKLEEEE